MQAQFRPGGVGARVQRGLQAAAPAQRIGDHGDVRGLAHGQYWAGDDVIVDDGRVGSQPLCEEPLQGLPLLPDEGHGQPADRAGDGKDGGRVRF